MQEEITKHTNNRFSRELQKINEDPGPHCKKYWKLVKNLKLRPTGIPAHQIDGTRLVTNLEKSEAFADHFQSIHDESSNVSTDVIY